MMSHFGARISDTSNHVGVWTLDQFYICVYKQGRCPNLIGSALVCRGLPLPNSRSTVLNILGQSCVVDICYPNIFSEIIRIVKMLISTSVNK